MSILQGSVTFSRFRVEAAAGHSTDYKRSIPKALRTSAFEPIDRKHDEERASGFVELDNSDSAEFSVGSLFSGDNALFAFRIDTLRVPSSLLKAELAKWEQHFAQENDRKPSRQERAESRTAIKHILLQRANPTSKVYDVSWNLKTEELFIWASSRKVIEEVLAALEQIFKVKLEGKVPVSVAKQLGVSENSLNPTAELLSVEMESEVLHGAA